MDYSPHAAFPFVAMLATSSFRPRLSLQLPAPGSCSVLGPPEFLRGLLPKDVILGCDPKDVTLTLGSAATWLVEARRGVMGTMYVCGAGVRAGP